MGFDKNKIKDVAKLFNWSPDFERTCRTRTWTTFDVAAVHCVSFMFELTYDLLLFPNSVSQGPCFESLLGNKYSKYVRSQHK